MTGTLTVEIESDQDGLFPVMESRDFCWQDTYPDIKIGAPVTVTDETQRVVGVSQVHASEVSDTVEHGGKTYITECLYRFEVANVPRGANFFGVAIGNRRSIQLPAEEAEHPELSLGD
jgi:hypothetical protein